ncbi:hypothetical protein RSOLAG1IB_03719 [Rhizoctonia solani AG-1 IB]|uniref:Uncharacterized protein n=1 Tax=Thanatephorus cucumeris (strain AG1-IB / isolate 7/3/14) TaxID=1108050 RepID=A0A0B7FQ30_THACB|nr:hypothetical protein RSOLAG1IB_03719 [Rhizoctonia solani AG-1 IB]
MSAATSFSPPLGQFSICGEDLSVQNKMNEALAHQSLPSGEESVDEVQRNIDAQSDELLMDEDRAQIDELEEDVNNDIHYQFDLQASEQSLNDQPKLMQTNETVDLVENLNDVTHPPAEQAVSIAEPTEDPPQPDLIADSLISETDAILQAEADATKSITNNTEFVSFEEGDLEIPEEGYEIPTSFIEQEIPEISALNEGFAVEPVDVLANVAEHQSNEQHLSQDDLQVVEPEPIVAPEPLVQSHEDTGAPPLHRMDEDTIPVTTHSKDSIIDALNDAPGTTADESIHLATTEEPVSQSNGIVTSTKATPEPVDTEMNEQEDSGQVQESISALVVAHAEHVEILVPDNEDGGEDLVMESNQFVAEQIGEPSVDITVQESVDHQPVQPSQEPTPEVQAEPTILNTIQDETVVDGGDVDGLIVTDIERSTAITEEVLVEQPQSEPPADYTPEALEDVAATVAITTISVDPTVAEPIVPTIGLDDMETDQIERAAQIQQEQDATIEVTQVEVHIQDVTQTQEETQPTLVVEPDATTKNAASADNTPDLTAPKDSDSPLRQASQSQPLSEAEPDTAQAASPIDPLVTEQEETDTPEESSESAKPQHHVATDPSTATPSAAPSGRRSPEWSSFGELDQEGAPGSEEPEDPSSEPSEYPDVLTEDSPLNPTSASNDKARKPSNSPTPTASVPKRKKRPRMIMEVVIPVPPSKRQIVEETKPAKRRPGRPPKKPKATYVPELKEPKPSAADTSSPRQSSSIGTPSPVKSETSRQGLGQSASKVQRSGDKRPKPFGSRKSAKKFAASRSSTSARPVHATRASKVEVLMPNRPRPSVLRRVGSIASGNNVKFASASSVTGKRKAESEPDTGEETDMDADGETDDEYEDVEDVEDIKEEPKLKVEVVISPPKSRKRTRGVAIKAKKSPVKRPHRSSEARKMPAKLPETVSKGSRPTPKRRRLRR